MEFKVGDKLRYVGCSREWYTKGTVYEVASIDEDEGEIWIVINDNKGLYTGWKVADIPDFFERIDEPQRQQVTKVVLTKEQAAALEWLKEKDAVRDVNAVLTAHLCNEIPWKSECESLNALNAGELAIALLVGYEVERTPEEIVLGLYIAATENHDKAFDQRNAEIKSTMTGYINGIVATLNAFGITIKGINDKEETE